MPGALFPLNHQTFLSVIWAAMEAELADTTSLPTWDVSSVIPTPEDIKSAIKLIKLFKASDLDDIPLSLFDDDAQVVPQELVDLLSKTWFMEEIFQLPPSSLLQLP